MRWETLQKLPTKDVPLPREKYLEGRGEQVLEELSEARKTSLGRLVDLREERERRLKEITKSSSLPENGQAPFVQEAERSLAGLERETEQKIQAKQKSLAKRFGEFIRRHPIFAMGVVSAALHGALIAKGMEVSDDVKKEVPDMVFRPQSPEQMEAMKKRREERLKRADPKEAASYKAQIREQIEQGREGTYEESYMNLERLNGVEPENLDAAKQKIEQLVGDFATRFIGDDELDEKEIRAFSQEMFGPKEDHVWGQGSVTEYLLTHKHNCESLARAEVMVLERIIAQMDHDHRQNYIVGKKYSKQHEVATLTVRGKDGGPDVIYELGGDVKTHLDEPEQVGTKTVSLDELKHALVAEKPLRIAAVSSSETPIEKTPTIITEHDDPVADGIEIIGELAGSSEISQLAKEQGIEPEIVQKLEPGTTEVEVFYVDEPTLVTVSMETADAYYQDYIKAGKEEFEFSPHWPMSSASLTVHDVEELAAYQWKNPPSRLYLDASRIQPDAVRVLAKEFSAWRKFDISNGKASTSFKEIVLAEIGLEGQENIHLFLDEFAARYLREGASSRLPDPVIELFSSNRADLPALLNHKSLPVIGVSFFLPVTLTPEEAHQIVQGKIPVVKIAQATITDDVYQILENGDPSIGLAAKDYLELLKRHPELKDSKRIFPWVEQPLNPDAYRDFPSSVKPQVEEIVHRSQKIARG